MAAPHDAPSPALEPPPGNPRFPLFDGLRGIAVLGILSFHVSEFTAQLGMGVLGRLYEVAGSEAVHVFFAISGFLLYRPYAAAHAEGKAGTAARIYGRRRALRILPAYWTVLTLLAIYPGIRGVFSGDWWRYYGYLQVYAGRTVGGGIQVAWTLCVEVSFYLALPLWAIAMHRLGGRGRWLAIELTSLAVVMAGGLAVYLGSAHHLVGYLVETTLAGQCFWLATGMGIAVLSVAAGRREAGLDRAAGFVGRQPVLCWIAAAGAFAGLMALVPRGGLFGLIALTQRQQSATTTAAKLALGAAFIALLLAPAVFGDGRSGLPRRLLRLRPVVWLGVISYSFYLWHLTVVELLATPGHGAFSASGWNLMSHIHAARTLVLYALSFALTGLLATLSYRYVELPFLRRK